MESPSPVHQGEPPKANWPWPEVLLPHARAERVEKPRRTRNCEIISERSVWRSEDKDTLGIYMGQGVDRRGHGNNGHGGDSQSRLIAPHGKARW